MQSLPKSQNAGPVQSRPPLNVHLELGAAGSFRLPAGSCWTRSCQRGPGAVLLLLLGAGDAWNAGQVGRRGPGKGAVPPADEEVPVIDNAGPAWGSAEDGASWSLRVVPGHL